MLLLLQFGCKSSKVPVQPGDQVIRDQRSPVHPEYREDEGAEDPVHPGNSGDQGAWCILGTEAVRASFDPSLNQR